MTPSTQKKSYATENTFPAIPTMSRKFSDKKNMASTKTIAYVEPVSLTKQEFRNESNDGIKKASLQTKPLSQEMPTSRSRNKYQNKLGYQTKTTSTKRQSGGGNPCEQKKGFAIEEDLMDFSIDGLRLSDDNGTPVGNIEDLIDCCEDGLQVHGNEGLATVSSNMQDLMDLQMGEALIDIDDHEEVKYDRENGQGEKTAVFTKKESETDLQANLKKSRWVGHSVSRSLI